MTEKSELTPLSSIAVWMPNSTTAPLKNRVYHKAVHEYRSVYHALCSKSRKLNPLQAVEVDEQTFEVLGSVKRPLCDNCTIKLGQAWNQRRSQRDRTEA